ncbi:hypothetical protein SASPL_156147 [Salvia splendens]|uniref:Uncharacterized protein n=1 Tax=Salvia splendens TaxID=180675 RepID=A0A8X8YXA0_SALSN|nr:hypothetical protein SASPL_156147 [Salvia splendens]
MSSTLHSPLSSTLSPTSSLQANPKLSHLSLYMYVKRLRIPARSVDSAVVFKPRRFYPSIRAAANFSSSVDTGLSTELDAVTSYSEIVPDTVVFDDFERFPPTAATVSSSLLLGICSLPDTKFRSAVDTALADSECYAFEKSDDRISCFVNKAFVNVGGDLAKLVPGRVSTEVDARLAYDTQAIVQKGIDASRILELEGIQTHMTFVYRY